MRWMLHYICLAVVMVLMAGCLGLGRLSAVTANSGTLNNGAGQTNTPVTKTAPPPAVFGLTDDVVILPIKMANEFPMVAAKINGVAGEMMFDTGTEEALSINDKAVPLQGGKVIGEGFFGSGEKYEVKRYPTVSSINLAGSLSYRDLHDVIGQNLSFKPQGVEGIFLGFIGYKFFNGYLFKLDYSAQQVTFYKQTEARRASKDFLKDETIIAVIPFETRKLPNHPMFSLKIGEESFLGCLDTGQLGEISMNKATRAKLIKNHLLTPNVGEDEPTLNLSSLAFSPTFTASVSGIYDAGEDAAAAEPLGITEKNVITFGYAFLSQYKTVWDFGERKLYLLKR